jgi:anti-sigma B factor antagonist
MPDPAPTGPPAVGAAAMGEQLDTAITRPRPGAVVLDVHGEIDTLTAPALEAAVAELMAGADDTIVVDLTGVRFLASSGLAVLIQAAHRAEERGTRLRLVATTRAVRRPLEITGTDQLFDMHTDVAAATTASD